MSGQFNPARRIAAAHLRIRCLTCLFETVSQPQILQRCSRIVRGKDKTHVVQTERYIDRGASFRESSRQCQTTTFARMDCLCLHTSEPWRAMAVEAMRAIEILARCTCSGTCMSPNNVANMSCARFRPVWLHKPSSEYRSKPIC
jgi:hypothetical protein